MIITTDRIPDVGMVKERRSGEGNWVVTVLMAGLTPTKARQLAAELLNAAEECERFTREGR